MDSGHCGIKDSELADTLAKKGTAWWTGVFPHNEGLNQKRIPDLNNEGLNQERIPDHTNELKARTKEKQWTVETKGKQWTVALSDIADWLRIEAVAEPLMSLDYVPNTIAYKHLHRLGVYTQLTCTHLHRLGVYTQPTCSYVTYRRKWRRPIWFGVQPRRQRRKARDTGKQEDG
ncbi:unnamed protein product [Rodentolepis nana]|uniref:tRNA_int_endo_N domain-containing protein n=1 Tax=Rodentolepis nana TaxID=102285 RepID=A0A0R3T799_RODNA|nr:unnamed protein product [Rodentolepis nana]